MHRWRLKNDGNIIIHRFTATLFEGTDWSKQSKHYKIEEIINNFPKFGGPRVLSFVMVRSAGRCGGPGRAGEDRRGLRTEWHIPSNSWRSQLIQAANSFSVISVMSDEDAKLKQLFVSVRINFYLRWNHKICLLSSDFSCCTFRK